jgi:hypothetical protein
MEPYTAETLKQQVMSYLAERTEAQPWNVLRQLRHGLSPITSTQGGKRNNETAGDLDTFMSRVTDPAFGDLVSHYVDLEPEEVKRLDQTPRPFYPGSVL